MINFTTRRKLSILSPGISIILFLAGCTAKQEYRFPDNKKLAKEYFNEDAQWFLDNIPFFECSDKNIEEVYYYRWKMYKAHIRNTGPDKYVITEFINHMGWDNEPQCVINAASMHHIYEGRWLRDNSFMDGYINYLYQDGGNNRRYSESIADAAYARYLVDGDSAFLVKQLDSMQQMYNGWYDHWDSTKNLYYIPAMPDATEYTIASIDASGGTAGFDGGIAFRPTINSYMYGNAIAISKIAAMKGDNTASRQFLQRANELKKLVTDSLWNDSLQHFLDRFKEDNKYVHYWNFIRGRELAGLAPWYFNLPPDDKKYNAAWKHAIDTNALLGAYGFRTNEPSYEHYFKQFVYFQGQRGSQWNGPSWPYQSSMMLTGLANFINNYKQDVVTTSDYLKLLRLYAKQHYLPDGKLNLVENYDPNLGGPIVYYYWSNHYNHSSFNNLVISGLCGIHPSDSDTLDINPLIDTSINYFYLSDIKYHGHSLALTYDKDGSRYKTGKGLTVFVDGKKVTLSENEGRYKVYVGAKIVQPATKHPTNYALNISKKGYPLASASVPDSVEQAVDGRIWYFPEIFNRWSTLNSTSTNDWFAIDFGETRQISTIKIYPFVDQGKYAVPDSISLQYEMNNEWKPIIIKNQQPMQFIGNTENSFLFDKIAATRIRLNFKHTTKQVAISEIECY
jgi:hypothetical protein